MPLIAEHKVGGMYGEQFHDVLAGQPCACWSAMCVLVTSATRMAAQKCAVNTTSCETTSCEHHKL
jgi:hypothetical protein